MVPAPIPGSCLVEFKQSPRVEGLRRDQLSAMIPASGWVVPSASGAELASGLQVARSTYMTLGNNKRKRNRPKALAYAVLSSRLWTSGHGAPYAARRATARHGGGLLCHAAAPPT